MIKQIKDPSDARRLRIDNIVVVSFEFGFSEILARLLPGDRAVAVDDKPVPVVYLKM